MKYLLIETDKIISNIERIRELAGDAEFIAVLKANAYGMGLREIYPILRQCGVRKLAVTEPEDALRLRQMGAEDEEILVLRSTACAEDIEKILEACATASIGSYDAAVALNGMAEQNGVSCDVHIKIDTGMGRYGFLPSQMETVHSLYEGNPNIAFTGIYTHFYNSSELAPTQVQFDKFMAVVNELQAAGIDTGMVHCCNSSAFLKYEHMHCDGARVGSALLGRVTIGGGTGLKVVGDCQAELEEIRTIPAGHTVGYGAGWVAKRETRIAVLSIGYFNGFGVDRGFDLWRLQDCLRGVARYIKAFLKRKALYVTVNGYNCRVLGHVGMVNMVIDVTDCDCRVGDMAHVNINPLLVKGVEIVYF